VLTSRGKGDQVKSMTRRACGALCEGGLELSKLALVVKACKTVGEGRGGQASNDGEEERNILRRDKDKAGLRRQPQRVRRRQRRAGRQRGADCGKSIKRLKLGRPSTEFGRG
jgi:hypothetical protein